MKQAVARAQIYRVLCLKMQVFSTPVMRFMPILAHFSTRYVAMLSRCFMVDAKALSARACVAKDSVAQLNFATVLAVRQGVHRWRIFLGWLEG